MLTTTGAYIISAMIVGAVNNGSYISKPQMSIPKPPVIAKELRRDYEIWIRRRELVKIREIVRLLGGKPHYAETIIKAGREFEVDPVLIASLVFVESSFRPDAVSNRNARGMMQLRPIVLEVLGVTDPLDPHENIMAGTAYLRNCFERYAQHPNSTFLALAAYNIGPGSTNKLTSSDAAHRFVQKVLKVYNRMSDEPIKEILPNSSRQTQR